MKNDFAKIQEEIDAMQPELVRIRRDLHRFPETGWLEMRTTAILAKAVSYTHLTLPTTTEV